MDMKKRFLHLFSLMLAVLMLIPCVGSAEEAEAVDNGVMREGLTALEATRLMGNGINLGNTLEACDNNVGIKTNAPLSYETYWGQPKTTQAMIDGMKAAGFDTIRIPVAWMTNATHLYEGDYTIDADYMDRVEEVVRYARKAGMYVIVNDHWDGGWYGMFGSESAETRALAMEAYKGMWQQIAERFRDYSDYLIFESANEELGGRFDENSPLYCSDSVVTYLTDDERYALTNEINQTFVDVVRATGGNNATRLLLIAGYSTNIDQTCDDRFQMPKDTADSKLMVSVHYYDPWSYCGASSAASATKWGTVSDYEYMDQQLAKMTKFTEAGYGVVIGEYGALPCSDGLKDNTLAYHTAFLDACTKYDLTNCLWDCSGLYKRVSQTFADDDILAMYQEKRQANEEGQDYADVQAAAAAEAAAAAAEAPVTFQQDAVVVDDQTALAWIMWNDGSWALTHSVGDTYNADAISEGLVATNAIITGEGKYTVGLDFTGTAQGYSASVAFAAIGISNGEALYPNYLVNIKEVRINGEIYRLKGRAYTTSDDGLCTRVNLYNEWVTSVPKTARLPGGNLAGATPTPINRNDAVIAEIKTIEIDFEYVPMN
ncbi:MAG: glycoside hydrolase family 5 protein [Clostridiales bacterium]|nr:glycoside hydrolase family 5 protein [Clostridiales bacterium]MBD9172997.1 glycoside hydrolase family 5 protein [Clostridiales bacterium]